MAKKLSGFDVKVIIYDPYTSDEAAKQSGVQKVTLNELFKNSDIVSVHARLTEANKKMIGKEQFAYFVKKKYNS